LTFSLSHSLSMLNPSQFAMSWVKTMYLGHSASD
jgi:hypothetical protein